MNPGIIHDDVYNQCNCQTNSGYFIRKDSNNLDECVACHPLCKKCHGTTFNDCDECWADINLIDTLKGSTCNCLVGYFYDSTKLTKADYCQPCHEFCKDCITTFKYCTKCNDIPGVHFDNYNCLCGGSVLPLLEYFVVVNTTLHKDTCVKCHPICTTCFGPYPDQCYGCDSNKGSYLVSGTNICTCDANKYYDNNDNICTPCHPYCKTCFGAGSKACSSCNDLALTVEGQSSVCTMDCISLSGGYYKDGKTCKSKIVSILMSSFALNLINQYIYII